VNEIPASALPHCASCGRPVERVELHEIVGFERDRSAGGTNHVVARHRTGRVVGSCCALRVQAGVPVEQGTLLDA
jgi:hypothetical protein